MDQIRENEDWNEVSDLEMWRTRPQ